MVMGKVGIEIFVEMSVLGLYETKKSLCLTVYISVTTDLPKTDDRIGLHNANIYFFLQKSSFRSSTSLKKQKQQ